MGRNYAECDCGWRALGEGPDDAKQRALEHAIVEAGREAAPATHCECYDPDSLEYGPDKCGGCRLIEAIDTYDAFLARYRPARKATA